MSKFKVWIDDINVSSSCQSSEIFADDSQREKGFRASTGASAIRVNTALRQANLIAVALVNALGIPDTYDLSSTLTNIEKWFKSTQLFKMSELFNVAAECTIKKTLLPSTTNSIDLGSSTKKFRTIYATTFNGNATSADDSMKVNGLKIERDAKGVLKIGDVIIPQKKVFFGENRQLTPNASLSQRTFENDNYDEDSIAGHTFEIHTTYGVSQKFKLQPSGASPQKIVVMDESLGTLFDIELFVTNVSTSTAGIIVIDWFNYEELSSIVNTIVITGIYEIIE